MSGILPTLHRRTASVRAQDAGRAQRAMRRRAGRFRRHLRRFGWGRALSILLLGAMALIRIWDPAPVETLRLRTFDTFQVLRPRAAAALPVAIVDIDEESLRAFGQWPWPRTRVAEMVARLTQAGAAAIVFDVVFAEPDRLSPARIAEALPQLDSATRETLASLPGNDAVLAEAIRGSTVILGQTALTRPVAWDGDEPPPYVGVGAIGTDPSRFLPSFAGVLRNVPVLEMAAAGRGLFTIVPERDGIVRRVPVLVEVEGRPMPTLTLEVLRVLTGGSSIAVRADESGIAGVRLPGFELPTDPHGQLWIHFGPHDPGRFISAKALLEGSVPQGRLAKQIVLVGTSAIGLLDIKTTPIDPVMPGVEVHAQVLESALTGTILSYPPYAIVVELFVAMTVGAGIIMLAPVLGALNLLLLGACVAVFLAGASWWRFVHNGVLLDPTYPLVSSFVIYLAIVFSNYFREQIGRYRIRQAFGQYLSPALVEQLAQSPESLKLGGDERVMTIMFSDVRGFTAISESYRQDPQGLTALMNRFLTPLTNAILDQGGTIDKYMGDAIMAFWNAPLADPRQEHHACAAALEMLRRIEILNAQRAEEARAGGHVFIPLSVGIGLNTGSCVVGNMGSDLRFDYSVLGDTVNISSRLEGQSKTYGLRTILGSSTAAAVAEDFAVIEIDRIQVKGKTAPETIFALIGDGAVLRSASFQTLRAAHDAMLAAYRAQDWDGAVQHLDRSRDAGAAFALDLLYALFAQRIAAFRDDPPGPDWAGHYVARDK